MKTEIYLVQNSEFSKMAKLAFFEFLDSPKLISRKIRAAEKGNY